MVRRRVPRLVALVLALLSAACSASNGTPTDIAASGGGTSPTATPSPTPLTASELFTLQRSGVVRIAASTCTGVASGTGFFISKRFVATVAHVVEGATAVSVRGDNGVLRGTVVGRDPQRDLALIRIEPDSQGRLNTGYQFAFAGTSPGVGDRIAIYGYAGGEPLSRQDGALTSADREIELPAGLIRGVFQQSAPTYPGNSGGPVINQAGQVVGLVDAVESYQVLRQTDNGSTESVAIPAVGAAYAIPTTTAATQLAAWADKPVAVPFASCTWKLAPVLTVKSTHPEAHVLQLLFYFYFDDLQRAKAATTDTDRNQLYAHAWSLLGRSLRDSYGSLDAFVAKQQAMTVTDAVFEAALFKDVTHDTADVRFRTHPDPSAGGSGPGCTQVHNRYTASLATGTWVLESVTAIEAPKACA